MNRFQKFESSFNQAISAIKTYLETNNHREGMDGLTEWLLTTDANPYSYLPESWAGFIGSAEGFASLLNIIAHALYDDGDITFVTVNGEPRIVFTNQYDENFRDLVLSRQEKEIEKRNIFGKSSRYEIQVLNIKPQDFGKLHDSYERNRTKQCFIHDAALKGLEFATKHYKSIPHWDDDWPVSCKEEIEQRTKIFS